MRKKRVLQIPNYYAPHIGGIEQTCQYLSEGLSDEYDVHVVCFSEDKNDKVEELNGVKIFKAGVNLFIARQSLSLSYYGILKKQIQEWKPDIIHFHAPNPFVNLLLLLTIPKDTKLYLQWHFDITRQKKIYPFIKPLETRLIKRADLITTTSPNNRLKSKPLHSYLGKVEVLQSAIDTHNLDLREGENDYVQTIKEKYNNKPIIFFIGRHVAHKGILELIKAEPYIKDDCEIIIAGKGPLTEEAKSLTNSNRVHFVGRISDDEKRLYYHAAQIYAFPSYTTAEGFGLTLAEAMYCGAVPVTYTIDGSGVNWVSLKDVTGLEVDNQNYKEFASAIDYILANPDKAKKFSQNAHERVVNYFTIEKEVELLKSQYKKLLEL